MSFLSDIGLGFVDDALHSIDDALQPIYVPAAVATAAYFTGGAALSAMGAEAATATAAAEAATVATAAEAGVGFEAYMAANGVQAASAASLGSALKTASSAVNLAGNTAKLIGLSKMNATTPSATGIMNSLAPSPIQTQSGLITTTPQGPVIAATAANGSSTAQQTAMPKTDILIIGAAIVGIYFLMKKG